MKTLLCSVAAFLLVLSASTDTSAVTRLLICTNDAGTITFDICGVKGCPAVITVDTTSTKYIFTRKKSANGALEYNTKKNKKPKCKVGISPLKYGIRKVTTATCAKSLKNATCVFHDV